MNWNRAIPPGHLSSTTTERPTCAVHGMPRPGAICGLVIVGMKFCGHTGECQHKRQPADAKANTADIIDMSEE